jgi:hypothetical protein
MRNYLLSKQFTNRKFLDLKIWSKTISLITTGTVSFSKVFHLKSMATLIHPFFSNANCEFFYEFSSYIK